MTSFFLDNKLLLKDASFANWLEGIGGSGFYYWSYSIGSLIITLSFIGLATLLVILLGQKKTLPLRPVLWFFAISITLTGFSLLADLAELSQLQFYLASFIRLGAALFSLLAFLLVIHYFPAVRKFKAVEDFEKTESQLRSAQAELEYKVRQLQVKNEEIQQLATMVSHDLKAPLQSFMSVLDLLKRQTDLLDQEDPKEYIQYLEESSKRMQTLVTDLLDYARLGSERELSEVDLEEVLSQVKEDLFSQIRNRQAIIRAEPLPKLKGFKTELRMLFQNLISNALNFSTEAQPPQLIIFAEEREDDWLFVFEDNGRGISREDQQKIFLIFQTIPDSSLDESSGIGLAHCKKIVEMHGGHIWVLSEAGSGSAFHFTLPKNPPVEEIKIRKVPGGNILE